MNLDTVRAILFGISYKDWRFLAAERGGEMYLQIGWDDPGEGPQTSRKWFLSRHMTKSEVVTTALKAVLTAEEHEARERFRYDGVRIFGPHISVDALVGLARYAKNLDLRD